MATHRSVVEPALSGQGHHHGIVNWVGRGLAIGGVAALAACAGDDEPVADDSTATTAGTEAETTTTAADGVPDVAAEYLDLLGGGDLGGMDRAVEFAADGSPAEL